MHTNRVRAPLNAPTPPLAPLHAIHAPDGATWLSPPPRLWVNPHHNPGGPAYVTGRRFRRAKERAQRKAVRR